MVTLRCPSCSTLVEVDPSQRPVCSNCGRTGPAPSGHGAPAPAGPAPAPARAATGGPAHTQALAEAEAAGRAQDAGAQTTYAPGAPGYEPGASYAGAPQYRSAAPSEGQGLAALLVNILVPLFTGLAGIGTLIGGRVGEGVTQLALSIALWGFLFVSFILTIFVIGLFMIPIVFLAGVGLYAWNIVSGVQIYQESQKARRQWTAAQGSGW